MLLFVLAVGLAVTLGLMNFVNLAHGAFAMAGGYVTVLLMDRLGVPFLATLPLAFLVAARARRGARAHALPADVRNARTSTRCCSRSASCSWRWRRSTTSSARTQQIIQLPAFLQGRFEVGWRRHRRATGCSSSSSALRADASALQWVLARTRFGSRLRAAVDDPRVAARPRHQRQPDLPASPSRSARASPAWAARSAPKCWGSTRPSRSSS